MEQSNVFVARMSLLGTILLATVGFAQAPEVKSWRNPGDGDVRTQITVRSSPGAAPPAVLLIECNRPTKRESSIGIYLIAGPELEEIPETAAGDEGVLCGIAEDGRPCARCELRHEPS
jgi:hypothetical protein